jgi:Copper transport outer membrane protein, MctB
MGYSARYHAASLAAVFLALAVGILIGVGFGSDIVTGTADDIEQSLQADLEDRAAEIDSLQQQLQTERDFDQAVFPAIVGGRLRGQRVALVALGGLDPGIANALENAVEPAGGRLTEVAVVREPPDLGALSSTTGGREARAVARGADDDLRRLAQRAGRALVFGGPTFDELRGTLLSRFSGTPGNVDAVVVARSRPQDLDPDDESATDQIEQGLVEGLDSVSTTVGAERTDTDPSSIGFFEDRGIPSVDSVDLASGRVALVYTLDGTATGSFGVKDTADGLLPDLIPEGQGSAGVGG